MKLGNHLTSAYPFQVWWRLMSGVLITLPVQQLSSKGYNQPGKSLVHCLKFLLKLQTGVPNSHASWSWINRFQMYLQRFSLSTDRCSFDELRAPTTSTFRESLNFCGFYWYQFLETVYHQREYGTLQVCSIPSSSTCSTSSVQWI